MKLMSPYTSEAILMLERLRELKQERKTLDDRIKLLEKSLAVHATAGDLDDIKDDENDRTFRYNDNVYVFSPGRVTYDFTSCADVKAAEDNLKELKSVNVALGLAAKKLGQPFWTVK